ncbi:MAG: hypothetical protein PHE78_04515 [Candidatus Gastranaerophilales bacterium]|nr:hypothetical protein [Candidatus Gastranaerophilales bacterium]
MPFKKIADNIKTIQEIAEKTQNLEFKKAILALEKQIFELEKENFELKQALSKQQEFNMQLKDNLCWNLKEDGSKEEVPYCSTCWYDKNKAIPMHVGEYYYTCKVCKNKISNGKEIPATKFII